jgi:hypothetical protein
VASFAQHPLNPLNSIFIFLKRKEFDFAKEMKDKYWIYLINMIKDKEIKMGRSYKDKR